MRAIIMFYESHPMSTTSLLLEKHVGVLGPHAELYQNENKANEIVDNDQQRFMQVQPAISPARDLTLTFSHAFTDLE